MFVLVKVTKGRIEKMRRLTKFSFSDKLQFEWAQMTGKGWEIHTLTSIEPPDPDLRRAYDRFKFVVRYVADLKFDLMEIKQIIAITSIIISTDKHTDERLVKIRADYYSKTAYDNIKITTPRLNENLFNTLINGENFPRIIDDLECECFKYIDGCRAQQVLNFESAAELVENERTET